MTPRRHAQRQAPSFPTVSCSLHFAAMATVAGMRTQPPEDTPWQPSS